MMILLKCADVFQTTEKHEGRTQLHTDTEENQGRNINFWVAQIIGKWILYFCCLISWILLVCNLYSIRHMTYYTCTVIIWVHLWAAGDEMKFCTAAAELCCMHHALCTDALCCWKKIASMACLITASILLSYLLLMQHGSAVTKWWSLCLSAKQYTTFKWKHAISGLMFPQVVQKWGEVEK